MCDTVFTMQPLLYRHFDQHLEHQKVSVFKCPDCSLLYAQKQLMMDHIKVRRVLYMVTIGRFILPPSHQLFGTVPIIAKSSLGYLCSFPIRFL